MFRVRKEAQGGERVNDLQRILVINPGSTSTKIAVFDGERSLLEETLRHGSEELAAYPLVIDQYTLRKDAILNTLHEKGINLAKLHAVVGRGGLLKPIPGGTYAVNAAMLADLRAGVQGQHASNLGGLIAHEIAQQLHIPSFIVDPVVVDELQPLARISGLPEIPRISIFHALNQKAVARRAARDLGASYEKVNLIVAHLGGGVSVGAHAHGQVVDVNNALDGEGPFSPERAGGLPVGGLARLCFRSGMTEAQMMKRLVGQGGIVAYLGTNDGRQVAEMIAQGNEQAKTVFMAMAYQVAKEIGACAAVLAGQVDAIVLTGGLAHSQDLVAWISERVRFIAQVLIYPGEDEMTALAEGVLRVLRKEEQAKDYV